MSENPLNIAWEWSLTTGDPFIIPEAYPNARFCPSLEEMEQLTNSRNSTDNNYRQRLIDFMRSNQTRLVTYYDTNDLNPARGYLRLVRSLDLKKMHMEYGRGRIIMDKLPRNTPFLGSPDGVVNKIRNEDNGSLTGLAEDINHNALLGWLGAGTFPCNSRRCILCSKLGRSATVNLGPYGDLQLTKRGSCLTRNAVYVGICSQCEEEENFTCYFGESTQLLQQRCAEHVVHPCNSRSNLKEISGVDRRRAEVVRVIATGNDPDEVLRDWFAHVTPGGIHPQHQKMSVVDIIPNSFQRKLKEMTLVNETMFRNGDIDYRGMGRGCLNTYS